MRRFLERLRPNARRGSKPRCHWLTHGRPEQVSSRLNALAEPWGSVSADDQWMPEGFCRIEEAQLDKAERLLPKQDRDRLRSWWLAVSRPNTQTPNWDIVSTCTVDGRKGLLLVEAKAHTQELKVEDQVKATNPRNRARIAGCINETNAALKTWTNIHWALSYEHRYQMANRFAWSWKLTDLGYPVILIYLGFLEAEEMRCGTQSPFDSHSGWEGLVKSHSRPLFPAEVWDRQWGINGQPFVPRIRSIKIRYDGPYDVEVVDYH